MAGSLEEDLEAASLLAPEKAWVHFLGSPFLGPFSPDQFLRFIFLVPLSLDHFHSQSDLKDHELQYDQKQLSMYVIRRGPQCISPILLRNHALPENWVQILDSKRLPKVAATENFSMVSTLDTLEVMRGLQRVV